MEPDTNELAGLRPVEGASRLAKEPLSRLDRAHQLWEALSDQTLGFPEAATLGERIAEAMHRLSAGEDRALGTVMAELARDLPEPVASMAPPASKVENGRCGGFLISGEPITIVPKQNYTYIDRTLGTKTVLTAENTSDSPAFAALIVGHVHYRSGVPVRLNLASDDNSIFEIELGAEWLLTSPSVKILRLAPGRSRFLIMIVTEGQFSIYCDGVRVATGSVGREGRWGRMTLSVAPRLAPSGDMMLYRLSVWGLSSSEAASLSARLGEPGNYVAQALLESPATEKTAVSLARLCHNLDGLKLKLRDQQLDWVKQAASGFVDRNNDFYAAAITSRLRAEDAEEVARWTERRVGTAVVAVKDLTVELSHNPAEERRLHRVLKRKRKTFRAVDQVNFELHRGDVLGIIGHNGAGKSTLLRALCGLIDISAGRIEIANRFLLLRPGIGMRDELTGRENISSMAFYLGLEMHDVQALSDDIISFSELGAHIDKPVKYYSDGMRARLVFSIATSFAPDILFLDELLGAGDIGFQEKAQARLRSFLKKVGTVVIVTHGTDFVLQSCTKGLLMHHGRQVYFGDPEEAVTRYLLMLEG